VLVRAAEERRELVDDAATDRGEVGGGLQALLLRARGGELVEEVLGVLGVARPRLLRVGGASEDREEQQTEQGPAGHLPGPITSCHVGANARRRANVP
jgi:hypothetical protein